MPKLFKLFVLSFIVVLFFIFPIVSFAEEKIDSFDVNITASKDGSMNIKESITYDFGESDRHGIFRNIPLVSKVGDLYRVIEISGIKVQRDGRAETFKTDYSADNLEIKVGDPDKTITGAHNYIIIYTVKNGIGSNYEDHDEIYWNVTGNDWEIPIEKATANLTTDFGVNPDKALCFSRSGNLNAQYCSFAKAAPFNPFETTKPLEPGEGLTIVASYPVNTFPKSVLRTSKPNDPDLVNFLKFYAVVFVGLNLLLAPYLLFRYFKTKSKVRFGPAVVNFDIPKERGKILTPSEVGIIDNTRIGKQDIIAMIYDLAIRKYIKIEEVNIKKSFLPDENDYKIIKLKDYEDLTKFEKDLLDELFSERNSIKLQDLPADFYLTFASIEKSVFASLVSKKIYTKNPKNEKSFLLFMALIAIFTVNIILGIVLIFLAQKRNDRTDLGNKLHWEIDGLKIFLKSVSRYYKFQTKNLITVEKYIPYAIALGLQVEFMDQLKVINPDYQPNWYTGSHGFYTGYTSINTSFSTMTTSAPSSSSGFSSGGSSGGGGGGGGGGSW